MRLVRYQNIYPEASNPNPDNKSTDPDLGTPNFSDMQIYPNPNIIYIYFKISIEIFVKKY